jgi:hypothetical protein
MPIISAFFGMIFRIFHSDHNPPHIHVQYGEMEAIIEIKTGKILHGKIPKRLQPVVKEWMKLRRLELVRAWDTAQAMKAPHRIKPME